MNTLRFKSYVIAALAAAQLGSVSFAESKPGPDPVDGAVLCGIDVLVRDNFKPLAGRRVGLITNHTGVDRFGRSTIELFHAAPDVTLVALFSPEHGLKGILDERVTDTTDPLTGLKVYSLYGETRRPSAEMLEGLDTLVFDIQDIGTRFYTYIATLGMCMEEAAAKNLRYVVLDRPNPITGTRVFGPFNDEDGRFTAYHTIPVVHGMTVGELAGMYNEERGINADLHVIKVENWKRSMWLDETLLVWINPSPNMRSLTEAALYPGIGLLEACNLSVGRGTDTPFEVFGAPWIEPRKLTAHLNGLGLKGVRFLAYRFTPDSSWYKGQECGGVQVILTDRDAFEPVETGLAIAKALEDLFGSEFQYERVNNLLFNKSVLQEVAKADRRTGFESFWKEDLRKFQERRAKFLLYP